MSHQETLRTSLNHIVVRSEQGNAMVRGDPRQLPRRLRVLLLAIDGGQPVSMYVQNLKGFGDVSLLLSELMTFGLVELHAKKPPAPQRSAELSAMDALFTDSRASSAEVSDVLYGATAPGSFDEMVRVAQLQSPGFKAPPTAPPAPVSSEAQMQQIESVFSLLDAVRGERRNLRGQLAKMQKIRSEAVNLYQRNQRLEQWVFGLGTACAALVVVLVLVLLRR